GLVQELVKSEAAEAEEIARLERLAAFEADLGLPRIQFFERDGLILLSRAGALPSEGSSSHISAKAQWDATGRLLCIEPPPSLCLQFEAASAVASGDLGRLLALMWDRASQCRQGQLEDVAPSC
ncbi:FP1, partial [Symbiodinium necroappetens]